MSGRNGEYEGSVALYWDFENLHANLCEAAQGEGAYGKPDNRFKVQEPLVNVQAIVEMAASFGPIAINRAYCNWQYFGRYRDVLLQSAMELIQLFPPGGSAKNGADIRLCLDAVEDLGRFSHIATVIVVGGDSDFMPVAQKIKALGRTLIGVGARPSTNRHWARSCHEFRYYEDVLERASEIALAPFAASSAPVTGTARQADPAAEILRRALHLLAQAHGDPWVEAGAVWRMMKRLDSTFDPREHGYADFRSLVQALSPAVEIRDQDSSPFIRLR